MDTLTRFPSYTQDELDAYREQVRRGAKLGYGRFYRISDWKDMAELAEAGIKFCDNTYGEHDAMRAVAAEVYREMESAVRAGRRDDDEEVREPRQNGSATSTGSTDRRDMASDKQKAFLESLLEGRTDPIANSARARIDSVSGHINRDTASQLIDSLMAAAPGVVAWKERMTTGQRDYLLSMWVENRGIAQITAKHVLTKVWLRTTKDQASAMIDRAKDAARGAKETARSTSGKAQEGFYEIGEKVVKVQLGTTSNNLYAKLLVVDPDLEKGFEWVYTPGLVTETIGAKPLSRERAAELGQELKLYGYCFKCGKRLTDEESIERGIGRICWEKM